MATVRSPNLSDKVTDGQRSVSDWTVNYRY